MFLEERLQCPNIHSSFGDAFSVQVSTTLLNRYAVMRHPYVTSSFALQFDNETIADQLDKTIKFFRRVGGIAGGFRFKNIADFSSNDYTEVPTMSDQLCEQIDSHHYQLIRWYDTPTLVAPRRMVKKPVAGSVILGVFDGASFTPKYDFTVDTTTGIVTVTGALSSFETLYAGFQFDIPVSFQTDLNGVEWKGADIMSASINLVEVLNPENL